MNYRSAVNYVLRVRPWSVHALLIAFLGVGLATCLRMIVAHFGGTLFFATYYPAILFVAVFAGVPGAVLVVLLTTIISWWFYFPPAFEFGPLTGTEIANLTTFWLTAGLTIWLAHHYRETLRSFLNSERARELLIGELNHRAGNTLAVLQAIVSASIASESDRKTIIERIQALARTNRLISETNDGYLRLSTLIRNETDPYANRERVQAEGPEVQLDAETGRNIALVVHELATNASKYGALSSGNGRLHIAWSCKDGKCLLHWNEIDGPAVTTPTRLGFGSRMIKASLSQVSGTIEPEFRPDGYSCRLTFRTSSSEHFGDTAPAVIRRGVPQNYQASGSSETI